MRFAARRAPTCSCGHRLHVTRRRRVRNPAQNLWRMGSNRVTPWLFKSEAGGLSLKLCIRVLKVHEFPGKLLDPEAFRSKDPQKGRSRGRPSLHRTSPPAAKLGAGVEK